MDRKTLGLLLTEALLIVVLIVVIAVDFNKPKVEKHTASHEAVTEHEAEAAAEPAEEAVAHEEKAEEKAEAKHEAAEEAAEVEEAKEEAPAEEAAEVKEEKTEEPAAQAAPAPAAAGGVADVIAMNDPAYEKHTKGIVEFTHKKHNEEYKIGCGDCHHNDKGEPLAELKMGDPVQGCIECHSKAGKAPKAKKGEKITDAQKREYHMNALHDNCIGCHKDYNKEKGTKAAPASCGKCHPKNK